MKYAHSILLNDDLVGIHFKFCAYLRILLKNCSKRSGLLAEKCPFYWKINEVRSQFKRRIVLERIWYM